MRLPARRTDDADLIRARLRTLLAEHQRGWLPDDLPGSRTDPWTPGEDDLVEGEEEAEEDEAASDDGPDGLPPEEGPPGRHRAPARTARVDPGRRGAASLWAAGLLAALVVAGWTWLQRPSVDPVGAAPPSPVSAAATPSDTAVGEASATSATVVVSVVGQVVSPGLVTLPGGSRVADAVAAAGGLVPGADPASVNLAAVVSDGQQVAVGGPGAAGPSGPGATGAPPGGTVDLNTATAADLDALPGVGPVLAQRIVDHREQHGRFTRVEQLDDVPGIGPALYARIAPRVRV